MKRDLGLAGTIGLLCGAGVYAGASALSTRIPILLQGTLLGAIALAFFFLLALIEVPLMMFGLRQMARSDSTPRRLVLATFGFFVAFAAVYASAFVLLTGQIALGLAIAAVCLARVVSGIWIE
ncbi:MAG: hypothetical protein L0Y55_03785 [Anaerolineales bacterium]|nr:hypothetical protein [Anaerolineales bacterium]